MGRRRRIALGAAGMGTAAIAVVGAARLGGTFTETLALRHALDRMPGVGVGALDIDLLRGRMTAERLALVGPGYRVTVGRATLSMPVPGLAALMSPAFAETAPAQSATADDIRVETPVATITVPHLEARATSLGDRDLAALFDPGAPMPVTDRLASLSAGGLIAPEVSVAFAKDDAGGGHASLTLRNVSLSDVVSGRIGSVSADGAAYALLRDGAFVETAESGAFRAASVDLPLALSIARDSRQDADAPLRPLYASFSLSGVQMKPFPTKRLEIGSIASGPLKGRPLLFKPDEAQHVLDALRTDPTLESRQRMAGYVADAAASFALDHFEVRGITAADTADGDQPTVKLEALTLDGFEALGFREIALQGLAVGGKDADVTLSRFALNGFSNAGALDAVRSHDWSRDEPTPEEIRRMIPRLEGATLADLRVEVPVKDGTGNANEGRTTRVDIPVMEIKAARPDGAGPSRVSTHVRTLYEIEPDAPDSRLQVMNRIGFGHLDVSTDYVVSWDEAARTARLDRFSVAAKDLAAVTLGADASDLGPELFEGDEAAKARAARQIRLRSATLDLVNDGLAEKALPFAAANAGASIPAYKRELARQAEEALSQALGSSGPAAELTKAVTAFIDRPKTFHLSVSAPGGITLQALGAAKTPEDVLDLVHLEVSANR